MRFFIQSSTGKGNFSDIHIIHVLCTDNVSMVQAQPCTGASVIFKGTLHFGLTSACLQRSHLLLTNRCVKCAKQLWWRFIFSGQVTPFSNNVLF